MPQTIKNKVFHVGNVFQKSTLPTTEDKIESIFIEGYANTVDKDRAGDVVPAYVWEQGIQEFLKNPIILAYHDQTEPVGEMIEYRVDSKGLWIKARISAAAEDTFNLIRDNVLKAFSVKFIIKDADYNSTADIFVIKELELLEISVVSIPMNQNSLFNISKSFETADEFKSFKECFIKGTDASAKGLENSDHLLSNEDDMTKEEMQAMLAEAAAKAAQATAEIIAKAAAEKEAKEAEEKAAIEKAAKEAEAKKAADVQLIESGAEKLVAVVEKRLADANTSVEKAMEDLRAELAQKALEIQALTQSKMTFGNSNSATLGDADKEKAVLLATIMGKSIDGTKFGKRLVEKFGAHVPSATWELEVSLNMEAQVRRRLVVANSIRAIQMETNVMTIPVNPEAGVATWITNAQFGTTNSPGAAQTHALTEITLNAYKVATREYLAYEEEEDALIALLPTIRDAMVRRVARAVDIAFLRGAGAGADPVKGLVPYDATSTVTVSAGSGAVTIANLVSLRKDLGYWGLDPAGMIYIVSQDAYYNLLDDTSFQTVDKVGVDRASLLTGQIGFVAGAPVLLSGEFEAKADTKAAVVAFAPANFLVGNQRGLRFDTQDLVETQRRVLVSSLRTGMTQLTTNLGGGVSVLRYTA